MTLIELAVILIIVGVALYFLKQIPMDATIATIIKVVVILWVLSVLGVFKMGSRIGAIFGLG